MRTESCFISLQRMALVGMMTLVTGGSNLFPLAAATLNTATVTLGSSTSTIACGGTVTYSATVTSSTSQTLTWFVDGIAKGSATVGALTPNGDQAHVLYTAPTLSGTHVVKAVATDATGAQVSQSTTLTVKGAASSTPVTPNITVVNITSIYLCDLSVSAGSSGQVVFQPVPTNAQATDFVWSTSAGTVTSPGTVGGSSLNGTVSASGLYTPPASPAVGAKGYRVWAVSKANSAVRDFCYVTIAASATACSIAAQPQSTTVTAGQAATFNVSVTSATPLRYQWRKNGSAISGATAASYSTPATIASDSGAKFTVGVTNAVGSVTSNEATLTVVNALTPAIQSFSASPSSITTGQGCILTWTGSGATQLSIAPSVGDVTGLSSKNVSPTATTTYKLTLQNAAGQTTTASTTVMVNPAQAAPTITVQPQSRTVNTGQTATFTVNATSTTSLNYQWWKSGTAISGATSASYTTPATTSSDSGAKFTVVVTNAAGSVASSAASLTVNPSQQKWFGFGSVATGGSGQSVVHVTNRNDSGAGSFRAALGSNRYIVFDVGGSITLNSKVECGSIANVTIDGSTAPSPGITFLMYPIQFNSSNNIIITNFRHRGGDYGGGDATGDGGNIVFYNCYNVILDHLSTSGYTDESIDMYGGTHDFTIQNCIVGTAAPNNDSLQYMAANHSYNGTMYHNLSYLGGYRCPAIGWDTTGGSTAPGIVGDVVNNIDWKYLNYGVTTYWGGKANIVGNYFYTTTHPGESGRAINFESNGTAYSSGNYSKDGSGVSGNVGSPYTVPDYAKIVATSAVEAANYVKADAGCRVGGLDAYDQTVINDLNP